MEPCILESCETIRHLLAEERTIYHTGAPHLRSFHYRGLWLMYKQVFFKSLNLCKTWTLCTLHIRKEFGVPLREIINYEYKLTVKQEVLISKSPQSNSEREDLFAF